MYLLFITVIYSSLQSCTSLIVDKKDVSARKEDINNKAKKSVETLYSIENDYNQNQQRYSYIQGYQSGINGNGHRNIAQGGTNTDGLHDYKINPYNYPLPHQHQVQVQVPLAKVEYPHPINPSQFLLQEHSLHTILASNPLLAALLLSQTLGIPPSVSTIGFNSPQHLPINPYVALLLSHYGRYIQPPGIKRHQRGIYGYAAANNYHNNQPFGSYKIYEDAKKK